VDLSQVMGVRMWRGQIVNPENLLSDLITAPSPFVLELRRQHAIECCMFLSRLQKAIRSIQTTYVSETGCPMVNAKQADAALATSDHSLTEDQRCLYVLRGFGKRLPDPPNVEVHGSLGSEHDPEQGLRRVSSAARRAAIFYKTRKLLQERMNELVAEDVTVPADFFVRRLSVEGVTKSSDMWHPEMSIQEVVHEAGLEIVRLTSASSHLQALCLGEQKSFTNRHRDRCNTGNQSISGDEPGSPTSTNRKASKASCMEWDSLPVEVVEQYYNHAVTGLDIQELSIGYTQVGLLHWLACPCEQR
jgi:hypothetical protein